MPRANTFSGTCKYIASDIDFTFLGNQKQLLQANMDAVKAAQNAGIAFGFITGRYWPSIINWTKMLDLQGLQVTDNGATIVEPQQNKIVYQKQLDYKLLSFYFHKLKAAGFYPTINDSLHYFATEVDDESMASMIFHEEYLTPISAEELEERLHHSVKLVVFSPERDEEIRRVTAEINKEAEALGYFANTVFTENGIFVMTPLGTDKLNGLKSVCKVMGISLNDTVAIGDGDNDKEMLAGAGLGFSVANGTAAAKAAATHIVSSNEDAGFAEAVYKIIEINRGH